MSDMSDTSDMQKAKEIPARRYGHKQQQVTPVLSENPESVRHLPEKACPDVSASGQSQLPVLREGLPPASCGEAKEITQQGETPVRDNGAGFAFRPQNTQSLSRQGKEAKSPAEAEYGPKRRNTPYVRDGVWLRDAPPSTPLDTLRCWGLLPRLERGELVLEGWEELDEPTRTGITRWLEYAGHRERVAGLLNKTHVAQGGI